MPKSKETQSIYEALLGQMPNQEIMNRVIAGSDFDPSMQQPTPAPAMPMAPGAGSIPPTPMANALMQKPMEQQQMAPNLDQARVAAFSKAFK